MARAVIDASVARASGPSDPNLGVKCLAFLQSIKFSKHHVAISSKLMDEWNKHKSLYATSWLAYMISSKRVDFVGECQFKKLLKDCRKAPVSQNERKEWQKDFHLICAAVMTDRSIFSLDDTARAIFASLCITVPEIADLEWLNPVSEPERTNEWIHRKNRQIRKHTLVNRS